ncbi:sulfate transporter permease CysT [Salmonella enterica subsp. enterica]|uniref:Sulfate transporter permease CysT n=1 Tax=Salmonella enterica I TaxID=59201 RepID=A0A447TYI5_SALET|nr:sulfate transporter permease CysT [Salmonella enterica subsp. enterica]
MIFVRLQEFDYPAASAIASVILAASLLLLFSINTLQSRFGSTCGKVINGGSDSIEAIRRPPH